MFAPVEVLTESESDERPTKRQRVAAQQGPASNPAEGGVPALQGQLAESQVVHPERAEAGQAAQLQPAQPPPSGRRSFKRKRKERSDSFRARMCSDATLRNLVGKACRKCKKKCLEQFKASENYARLKAFRRQWSELHKLDQDQVVFDRIRSILSEDRDEGTRVSWRIFGITVCQKAWMRLHGVGHSDCDLRLYVLFSFFFCCLFEAGESEVDWLIPNLVSRMPSYISHVKRHWAFQCQMYTSILICRVSTEHERYLY